MGMETLTQRAYDRLAKYVEDKTRHDVSIEIATMMFKDGLSADEIQKYTSLSVEEISNLNSEK
ncbi:hypothetical protein [uncultured Methanobrevibacter sp.]|uniref:hypothetical protein n=1 Tax=uncultured Methanobrevibacter sp. TaxID=253161 RepID=UPI0026259940